MLSDSAVFCSLHMNELWISPGNKLIGDNFNTPYGFDDLREKKSIGTNTVFPEDILTRP